MLSRMGWRVWDAYERDREERRRALPWRERFAWGRLALLALAVALALAYLYASVARAASIDPGDVTVIDGDTIRVHHKRPNVRLVGFNAPETRRAVCQAERDLGDKATRRVRELVRSGNLDFEFVACSCRPATEGTPACNYGRHCGTLKAAGRDVGEILIAEGLAVPFKCLGHSARRTPVITAEETTAWLVW
jgi:endonuclease YncB( thermonuclease family)